MAAAAPTGGPDRAIRVFVSSTFRDMQAEREELVKRVFPVVRRLCEERGVAWSEVDLRWGVTDEQKAEGAVLPICLAEIDRSRPYFLGLLGQRYGWVPEELPTGLSDQLPWLGSLPGTSVTEMEVLHGVLNDVDATGHAFFHLRDPAWVDTRPPEEQLVLGELPSAEETAALGVTGAEAAAGVRRQRLAELKQRVQDSPHPCATYADPADLGRQVLAELTALVERLFPLEEVPAEAGRDDAAHRAFGRARASGSLERPALLARLDAFAAGSEPPLVVSGAAGADLTPVVSTWLDAWRAAHRDHLVIEHHVGATSDSADWKDVAARVLSALDDRPAGDDAPALPVGAAPLRSALFAALARTERPVLVVVGGADLLSDVDGAPDLTWLPAELPAAVRVVVTSAGPRPVDAALRRGWPVTEVPPLDAAERAAYVATFLARWSKGLDPVHVRTLAASPHTGSVLYLRTVLDELRQHGDHFTLGEVIAGYLRAETLDDLLELVLARYERDFEADRPGLVADAFRAIWAARRGLTEPELLDLLGGEQPLSHAVWSPLVLAAETGLVTRSGLLGFATDAHRQAVTDRYLGTPTARRAAHAAVAAYFSGQPLGPRVVEELPWQQLGADDVDGLVRTISDLDYLALAYPQAPADLRRLWARAEERGHPTVEGYRHVLDDPGAHPDQAWAVARLVTDAGHPTEALTLHRHLVATSRAGSPTRLRGALLNLGAALQAQGELTEAATVLEEAVTLSRTAQDTVVLPYALGNLALVRAALGDVAGAVPLFEEALALARASGNAWDIQAALGNLAGARRTTGDTAGALALLDEQEELGRSVGDTTATGLARAGKAAVHADRGDPLAALADLEAWRAGAEERGDLSSQAEALVSESGTLRQLGRHPEAAQRAEAAEAIARRLSDEGLLARVLDVRARSAIDEGRWEDARRLATEAVLTARSGSVTAPLALALGSLGMALRELGDLAGARGAHTEELAVARQAGDDAAAAMALVNLAAVDIAGDDLPASLLKYAEAEPVLRSRGLAMALVPLLNNRWQVHSILGDQAAAIADLVDCGAQCAVSGAEQQRVQVLTKAIELMYQAGRQTETETVWAALADACARVHDDAGLQRAVGEQAMLVLARGDRDEAGRLLGMQEEVCRRTGDRVGLAACVGNQAILLQQLGDLTGALARLDEQLVLARASNNGQGVLFATANRGEVLGDLGRIQEGLDALAEARAMAAQWGLAPMAQQLDQMIAALRARPR
ncbi:tetratricopeptide repeat protein [Nocardioides sp. URHA0020]|uniref:tetratricopeptide repeat protein n=1 Tax=Nocardioides sp. URHA0020 TaxID=1380392 RepID=UPI00048E3F82|nr:tetratricopeptide repeat protein [Nocardioides sp. URHA0020]